MAVAVEQIPGVKQADSMEAQPAEPKLDTEILDVDKNGGLYGLFFIASQDQQHLADILDPKKTIIFDRGSVDPEKARDFNPITEGLSAKERFDAWKDEDPLIAMKKWETQFVSSVNSATNENQLDAIHVVTGVDASDFKDENAQGLYNDFCRGGSDTTKLVSSILGRLKKDDGRIHTERLRDLMPHLQRLSAQLFGKYTAEAVARMIELEAEVINNSDKVVDEIFENPNRINELKPQEVELLRRLRYGLNGQTTTQPEAARPEPATQPDVATQQSASSRPEPARTANIDMGALRQKGARVSTIHSLEEARDQINMNRIPIDPESGQPIAYDSSTKNAVLSSLDQRIQALQEEPTATAQPEVSTEPATARPEPAAQPEAARPEATTQRPTTAPPEVQTDTFTPQPAAARPEPTAKPEPAWWLLENPDTEPTTDASKLSKEERIRDLEKKIAAIEKGETPINSVTGQPMGALRPSTAIKVLERKIKEIQSESEAEPIHIDPKSIFATPEEKQTTEVPPAPLAEQIVKDSLSSARRNGDQPLESSDKDKILVGQKSS